MEAVKIAKEKYPHYLMDGELQLDAAIIPEIAKFTKQIYIADITKDKKYWRAMIQLLPTSYNQRRTIMLNYEVLRNMYTYRKEHKLDEWREFCAWIETLPYAGLITGKELSTE
mgnify:CR=1 FL=1